ncbi:hypothetical protein IAT38_007737 [Cryptococcus sp. DSM 104549]
MYSDLYHPFPLPIDPDEGLSKKSKKGKAKAAALAPAPGLKGCWDGVEAREREAFAKRISLSGHLGYSVAGCTIAPPESSTQVIPSPWQLSVPFPELDPRSPAHLPAGQASASGSASGSRPPMVQVTRYHVKLEDGKPHCFTAHNANNLRHYDILSVMPTSEKTLQSACIDLASPGPNQISIITLPLHESRFAFKFNYKQIRMAQKNGVVIEIMYSAALFPSNTGSENPRWYRQNWLSNAREVVRITGGKGIIFSSGPGGVENGLRGCLDIVNLGTLIGLSANLAKEAVEKTPKQVLLRAQARKTLKAIMTLPRYVPAPGEDAAPETIKRPAEEAGEEASSKKAKVAA